MAAAAPARRAAVGTWNPTLLTGSTSDLSMTYTHDGDGNVVTRTNGVHREDYTYDADNHLATAYLASGDADTGKSFTYDGLGNMTYRSDLGTMTYGAGTQGPHQLSSVTVDPASPYAASFATGTLRSYSWMSFDMPASVTADATGAKLTYTYDDRHRRITMVDSLAGTTTVYVWGEGAIVAEEVIGSSGSGTWQDFIFLGSMQAGMVSGGSTSYYYMTDAQGTVAAVTGGPAPSLEQDSYDAWGKRRYGNDSDDTSCSVTSETSQGYVGQEHLSDACLIHLNARLYDPLTAHFISADPMGLAAGGNRYAYAGSNPMTMADPTGMDSADQQTGEKVLPQNGNTCSGLACFYPTEAMYGIDTVPASVSLGLGQVGYFVGFSDSNTNDGGTGTSCSDTCGVGQTAANGGQETAGMAPAPDDMETVTVTASKYPNGTAVILGFTPVGNISAYTYYHSYVVLLGPDGQRYYMRGMPAHGGYPVSNSINDLSNPAPVDLPSSFGNLVVICCQAAQLMDEPFTTYMEVAGILYEPFADAVSQLQSYANQINVANIPYDPFGANSNSFAFGAVANFGLTRPIVTPWSPGSSVPLIRGVP